MKTKILGVLVAAMSTMPVWAGDGHGGGSGSTSTPTASASSTATGGAGGAGGSAAGGSAAGGSSTASGNTSTVSVSISTPTGSGTTSGAGDPSAAGEPGSSAYNTKANVDYSGSYTVKNVPSIIAPSLTATLSDTCMGSASFGFSVVGLGATGGTTIVDDACVRRLDSREFRAMGMNDVALALLCQSAANRKAVEATGRSCPAVMKEGAATSSKEIAAIPSAVSMKTQPTVVSLSTPAPASKGMSSEEYTDPLIRRRLGLDPLPEASASK